MKSIFYSITIVAALNVSILFVPRANAQLSPLNLNQNARGAASATQRARAQVQQRIQAQTQQRLQSQVQQRVQAQTQSRLRLSTGNSIRLKTNANAEARLDAEGSGQLGSFGTSAQGKSDSEAKAEAGIPVSLTAQEMSDLDVVFGDFNPFSRRGDDDGEKGPKKEKPRTAVVVGGDDDREEGRTENSGEAGVGPLRLWFESESEFQASILAAVRQRRAEISFMRDRALAKADAKLMSQADRLEGMLETYVATEAKARANAQSAVQGNPLRPRPGQAIIQAGAESESRAKVVVPSRNRGSDTDSSPE